MNKQIKTRKIIYLGLFLLLVLTGYMLFFSFSKKATNKLLATYQARQAIIISDRHGEIISIKPNADGYYSQYINNTPDNIKKLLIQKEDKYFLHHNGINPISNLRAIKNKILYNRGSGASTITQQLVKILLSQESDRTIPNKLKEATLSIALETHLNKDEIFNMYANSIFLGNKTQGLSVASQLYFGKNVDNLETAEIISLLATISNPSNSNPFKTNNQTASENLAKRLELKDIQLISINSQEQAKLLNNFQKYVNNEASFELNSLEIDLNKSCQTSLDQDLTRKLRTVSKDNIMKLYEKDATNASIVIIKVPENEVLTIIGSPDPSLNAYGYQINMAQKPRPIGSTIKPFLYFKGFENNLRPYTLVEDKEYKYTIGSGFAFYPKNYDYEYRGMVNLHYALSNSLNVPTVKVLEYIEVNDFYNYLINDLSFLPVQSSEDYQLSIALGGFETDLITLAHNFTMFPNQGELKNLYISKACNQVIRESKNKDRQAPDKTQLINKILSDRETGTEQFGAESNLNLNIKNYAVKTGTSRDYHDSWTIGYTPDFVVAVWVGNSNNTPMTDVSGQGGAGKIWHEVMNIMINSNYYTNKSFKDNYIYEYKSDNGIVYGLKNDDFENYKNLLLDNDLITSPHDGDIFLLENNTQIPLKASQDVEWRINDNVVARGSETIFQPSKIGQYKIKATGDKEEEINIFIVNEE